jgi:hypothetical protein
MGKYYVYQHLKLDDNLIFYIGIGCQRNYLRAYSKDNRSSYWDSIVKKHGYKIEVLHDNLSKEDAIKIEKTLISKYGRKDLGHGVLCNLTDGGDGILNVSDEIKNKISSILKGRKLSEETKRKMSESRKGKVHSGDTKKKIGLSKVGNKYMLGKKLNDEAKDKIRKSKIGDKNPMYNKEISQETRIKLSESHKGEKHPMYGKKHKEESKIKMSESKKLLFVGEKNPFYGKTHSAETIKRILETRKRNKLLKTINQ